MTTQLWGQSLRTSVAIVNHKFQTNISLCVVSVQPDWSLLLLVNTKNTKGSLYCKQGNLYTSSIFGHALLKLFTNFIVTFWWCCDHLHQAEEKCLMKVITASSKRCNKVCWTVHVRISSWCITTTATMTSSRLIGNTIMKFVSRSLLFPAMCRVLWKFHSSLGLQRDQH